MSDQHFRRNEGWRCDEFPRSDAYHSALRVVKFELPTGLFCARGFISKTEGLVAGDSRTTAPPRRGDWGGVYFNTGYADSVGNAEFRFN